MKKVNYDKKVFKLKPKWVFEKDSMSQYLVIHATIDKRSKVDQDLIKAKVGNGKYFKYILFKHSSLQMKIGSLHINKVNNTKV